ncbi:MAG: MFS transporter [Verrucomicrobiota bacterium]
MIPPVIQPTRTRYKVVGLAVLLAMVTYLDRACLGVLTPYIRRDLSFSEEQMSMVFSAFALAYALFEIPTAWWADRHGTRQVLTRIVAWWSTFTMATALAFNHVSMLAIRFLFGAGEAGAWPGVARSFSRWIPRHERGTIMGIFFAGAHLSGGLTPLLVVCMLNFMGWRMVFVCFGLIGFAWAVAWHHWFRNDPAEHPSVNAAELQLIEAGREPASGHHAGWDYWRCLLGQRNILALCFMYFPNSFVFYFCITWLPTYLNEKHGFDATLLAVFAGLPLILSVLGDLFGGFTTDAVTRKLGLRIGRAGVGAAAYVVAGVAMLGAAMTGHPVTAAVLISVALGASMFTLGAAWSTCQDIGGTHAGVVSAAMNTSGQIGGLLCPLVVTFLHKTYQDWNAPLFLMGGLFLMGAVGWCFVNPHKRIFD